jgi:hypothetical protein
MIDVAIRSIMPSDIPLSVVILKASRLNVVVPSYQIRYNLLSFLKVAKTADSLKAAYLN